VPASATTRRRIASGSPAAAAGAAAATRLSVWRGALTGGDEACGAGPAVAFAVAAAPVAPMAPNTPPPAAGAAREPTAWLSAPPDVSSERRLRKLRRDVAIAVCPLAAALVGTGLCSIRVFGPSTTSLRRRARAEASEPEEAEEVDDEDEEESVDDEAARLSRPTAATRPLAAAGGRKVGATAAFRAPARGRCPALPPARAIPLIAVGANARADLMARGFELNSKLSSSSAARVRALDVVRLASTFPLRTAAPTRLPPAAARIVEADGAPGLRLTATSELCPLRLYAPSASCNRVVSAGGPGEGGAPAFTAPPAAEIPAVPTPRKPGLAWDTRARAARGPPGAARTVPNGRPLARLRRRRMKNRAAAVSARITAAALPIPAKTGVVGPSVPACAASTPTAPDCDGAAAAASEIIDPTVKLEKAKLAAALLFATHAGTLVAPRRNGAAAAAAIPAAADASVAATASRRRYASSSATTTAESTAVVALSCTAVLATKPEAADGTNPGLGDTNTLPPDDSARSADKGTAGSATFPCAGVVTAAASIPSSLRLKLTVGTTAEVLSTGCPTMPKLLTASSSATTATPPVSPSRHHDSRARVATMPLPYRCEAGAGRNSTTLAASATVLTSGASRDAPPPAAHTAANGAPANANSKLTVSSKRGGAAATL